jgi:hypothetical protein
MGEHLFEHRPNQLAQLCEMREPPLAPDQQTAQLLLKLLNRASQRRRTHPAPFRRPRKAQRLAQHHKIPDLIQLHEVSRAFV